MKYMILTYGSQQDYDGMAGDATDQSAWSPADFAAMAAFMEAFNTELAETGELVETRALAAPVHTRRLGAQNGVPFVTDGPYAETQAVLAGYWVVECYSFDRATEIASRSSVVLRQTQDIEETERQQPGLVRTAAIAHCEVRVESSAPASTSQTEPRCRQVFQKLSLRREGRRPKRTAQCAPLQRRAPCSGRACSCQGSRRAMPRPAQQAAVSDDRHQQEQDAQPDLHPMGETRGI